MLRPFMVIFFLTWGRANAQGVFYARTHLQAAIDAEAYWFGPQAGLGLGVYWPSGFGIIAEYYAFSDKVNKIEDNWMEKGAFKQQTLTLMGGFYTGKSKGRGLYIMTGLAYQERLSHFENPLDAFEDNREHITAAFELGYRWSLSKSGYGISASLKCTGPITYDRQHHTEVIVDPVTNQPSWYYYGSSHTTEILTQLSAGIVLDRIFLKKK